MKEQPKICAILPAFNEEVSIGSMVLLTKNYVDEVFVVDDGSKDRTSEVAERAGATVIKNAQNSGKGVALKNGFLAAQNFDIIITMDADGQHNPRDIPRLLDPILSGKADIVNGSRYLNGMDKKTPFYRRFGQVILDTMTNINAQEKFTDTQSGFRAFNARSLKAFKFTENGFAIESEMLKNASDSGLKIEEVPIDVRYDVDGSTLNPISHGFRVFLKILHDMEYNKPLLYFLVPGVILTTSGIIIGLVFLDQYFHGQGLNFGPTLLMMLITLIGFYLTFTGIILHTISVLFKKIKD
jgi:glycosyltransferase involved in cell wall biosynthesis